MHLSFEATGKAEKNFLAKVRHEAKHYLRQEITRSAL
jgi:hypothetical protein